MKSSDIINEFQKVLDGCRRASKMKEKIFQKNEYQVWLEDFFALAKEQRKVFLDNEVILDKIFALVAQGDEESYDQLYGCLRLLGKRENSDPGLEEKILSILIPYFEKKGDSIELLYMYGRAGYVYMELSRVGMTKFGEMSISYYDKVLSYKENLELMSQDNGLIYVINAYMNIILSEPSAGNLSLEKAYAYWEELREYVAKDTIVQLFEKNEVARRNAQIAIDYFQKAAFEIYYEINSTEKEMFPKLVEIANAYYQGKHLSEDALENSLENDFYLYYLLQYELHRATAEQTFQKMLEHYHNNRHIELEQIHMAVDPIKVIISPYIEMVTLLHKTNLSWEEKHDYVERFGHDIVESMKYFKEGFYSYAMNQSLANVAKNDHFYSYLYPEEKLRFLVKLTVSRQISTTIHSHMVSRIARTILGQILEERPDLLVHCMGLHTVELIRERKNEILNFVHDASMFHDVGKNTMIDIIMTSHRKLTDNEREVILRHPENGTNFLQADPSFELYYDVVVGHHRFYDGTGGYDPEYDNVESDYRFLVDLITIADAVDAATDYLGRNFRKAKKFGEVFGELKEFSGSRYNPQIIDFIDSHEQLKKELEDIVGDGRTGIYYEIYQSYI